MKLLWYMVTSCLLVAARVGADRYHPASVEARGATPSRSNIQEKTAEYWRARAQAALKERSQHAPPAPKARNIVMFLGDGMSVPTLAAARILLGQRQGKNGEETEMFFEKFPTAGLVKTYCIDRQVADSACTATSYLAGVKTNGGMLGVTAAVARGDCAGGRLEQNQVSTIAEWALEAGLDVGVVTTTRVTHASPAGLFAKTSERDWETDADIVNAGYDTTTCPDITQQLVHMHPGNKFKVILGGGRRTFLPTNIIDEEGDSGRRTDNRNLIEEWQQEKRNRNVRHEYIWNREQLLSLNDDLPEYLLGLFESSHMQYHLESNTTTEPTLAELTETAIKMLSRNEKGFFLFVEGGRIDHAHHDNLVHLALDETLEMDAAVAKSVELLSDEDSLIVVTADHAHVMGFNGYSDRGHDILGTAGDRDRDGVPYMTLSYTNGPGFRPHVNGRRPDVTVEPNFRALDWATHTDINLQWETHGGDDVVVFARGPNHALLTGLYEQNHVPHRMAYAACIGPGLHACDSTTDNAAHALYTNHALVALTILLVMFYERRT